MRPEDEWAFAIGNFILNFGRLDLHVFEFLENHLSPDEFAKAKEKPFQQRLENAGAILSQRPEKTVAVQDLLKRVEPLRKLRNHLAHGHLMVKQDAATGKLSITIARTKDQDDSALSGNQPMTVAGLLEDSRTLLNLGNKFCSLADLYSTPEIKFTIHRSMEPDAGKS